MLLLSGVAFAGDLTISSDPVVYVYVDGTFYSPGPGANAVQLTGLSGVHRVQVAGMDSVQLAETQVQVPVQGARHVHYDGVSLVVSAPAPPQQVVVVQAPLPVAPVAPPAPVGPTAMSDGSFAALVAAVNSQTYGDGKVAAIRTAAAKNWFTIEQLGRLVDGMTYGSDAVSAVQVCAPKVVDPENAFALGSHFTYSSDAEAALAYFR